MSIYTPRLCVATSCTLDAISAQTAQHEEKADIIRNFLFLFMSIYTICISICILIYIHVYIYAQTVCRHLVYLGRD